ncbi:MAG: hypothetical protein CSA18_00805 [Deltaproteobacteria bacterium]|nr:MAG: hypothetical protein CSB21_00160 [Deltaproteobacteria bacterium]PIE75303.1 MAG: hypothetical protein CSA18_00805 [Deltaproteobacteria bacterium]
MPGVPDFIIVLSFICFLQPKFAPPLVKKNIYNSDTLNELEKKLEKTDSVEEFAEIVFNPSSARLKLKECNINML